MSAVEVSRQRPSFLQRVAFTTSRLAEFIGQKELIAQTGQVVDAWQFTIADVGPSGMDKGRAARYLFTPPGYRGPVPPGYLHVASPNYRIALAFRSVIVKGKTLEDAFKYAHRLRMYDLAEAGHPPKQKFVDPSDDRYATIPIYDERHFADLHAIFSVEPTFAPASGSVRPHTSVPLIERKTMVSLPIGSTTSMPASKVARFLDPLVFASVTCSGLIPNVSSCPTWLR